MPTITKGIKLVELEVYIHKHIHLHIHVHIDTPKDSKENILCSSLTALL